MITDIDLSCPYCGESFGTHIDTSAGSDETWEDCAVCCRPIRLCWRCDADGDLESVTVLRDDEV